MATTLDRLISALSDRYQIERELGKGGMATVYLARDVRHGRKVAVKVLLPELAAVLGAERFLAEIHVTAALQHPHILPLFDSGQVEGQLFYVMPYVEGESLRSKLDRERQLPLDEALQIARAVASALDYAHRRGVIHRDIKPENILLQDGHALVADFGIALAVSSAGGGRLTQTGLSLGTPQYMSPEQATGEREIGPRSDVYSLAAVTYEMLAGEAPHTGATMQAVIARMLTERPRNVRSMRASVPEHTAYALDKALEKIPADRWHSAGEFADVLEGKAAIPAGARVKEARTTPAVPRNFRAFLSPVPLVLAALAIGALGFAFYERQQVENRKPEAIIRFPIVPPRAFHFSTTNQQIVVISPDGRSLVFVGRNEGESERQLYVRSLDDLQIRGLKGTTLALTAFFSPDSRWIGFTDNSRLRKISIDGGAVVDIAPVRGIYGGTSWSNRGQILISMNAGRIYSVGDNGGTPTLACRHGDPGYIVETAPLALADGDTFLYSASTSSSTGAARLGIGSISSGKCTVLDASAVQPLGVVDGVVVYATLSGAIMAAPFDVGARRITGNPVPVLTDVDVNQTTGAVQASLSSNGTLVYLSGSAASQLVSVDGRGVGEPVVADSRNYAYPRYSPDGRRIAVAIASSGERDIWIVDVANGTASRLTTNASVNDRPEWTPDGKRVLYRTARSRRSALWWRAADMSDSESPLLTSEASDFYEGIFSPDGRYLVYQLDTAGADILYRQVSGDTQSRPVAATQFTEDMARVSPDGRWVAYTSFETGAEEVFVQPFPGSGPRVQVSLRGGSEPVWSRDGRKLFYRNEENVMAAAINTQGGLAVTSREVLFADGFVKRALPHANFDVSVDGTKFLFLKATSEPEAVVVYSWMNEVRSKLAASDSR